MNIEQLLNSTYKVGAEVASYRSKEGIAKNRRKPSYTFTQKPFGAIYINNMVVSYKTEAKIVEITMLMGVATDVNKPIHRLAIALKNVDFKEYTASGLCMLIKQEMPSLKEFEDWEIVELILEENYQPLKGRTILQKSTTERKFVVMKNEISTKDVEIQSRCSCTDYLHTFSFYNSKENCLIGMRAPTYQRKRFNENGSFTAIRNPNQRPGICKHLMLLLAILMNGGLIQSIPNIVHTAPKINNSPIIRNIDSVIEVMRDTSKNRFAKVERTNVDRLLKQLKESLRSSGEIRKGFNY